MPRGFDSDSRPEALTFEENVECPVCGEIFPSLFFDFTQSLTVEDMRVPPCGSHVCPDCGHEWVSQMTGWMMFGEAG